MASLGMVFAIANASFHLMLLKKFLLNFSDFKRGQMNSRESLDKLLNEMSSSSNSGNLLATSLNCLGEIFWHFVSRMRCRWLPLQDWIKSHPIYRGVERRWEFSRYINVSCFEALIFHPWSFAWFDSCPMKNLIQIHSRTEGTTSAAMLLLSLSCCRDKPNQSISHVAEPLNTTPVPKNLPN